MVSEGTAMTIEEVLVKEYGPLLSLAELATVLNRSPDGLRISLKSSSEWVRRINAARLRLGRRVLFSYFRDCKRTGRPVTSKSVL
jgi:hypothetical protein